MIEISGFFDTQRTSSRSNRAERSTPKLNSRSFNNLLDSAVIDEADPLPDVIAPGTDQSDSELLESINDAKKDLLHKPTWKRAQKYRDVVSKFLASTTKQLLKLESHESAINGPNRKKFVLVRKVHAELDALVDLVINSHGSALQILEKVGTIHGLLVNLQT